MAEPTSPQSDPLPDTRLECAQCREGAYGGAWPQPRRIAVNGDGPEYLHRCDICGTLWHFDMRFANPVPEERARRLFPAHFADWSPRGGGARLPQVVSGAAFAPPDPLYLRDVPPEGDLEQALAAAGAGRGGTASGDSALLMRLLRASVLYVPSATEPAADGSGMTPLALRRPPVVWVLAFTRLELAQRFAGDAPYCLSFVGSELIARLPEGFGLCLNFGAGSECLVGPQQSREQTPPPATVALEEYLGPMHFLPDGRTLVSRQWPGDVSLWHVSEARAERRAVFPSGLKRFYGIAASPDGSRLAALGEADAGEAQVRLLALPGGRQEGAYTFPDSSLHSAAFSPDGTRLLAAGGDEVLYVINLHTGAREFTAGTDEDDEEDDGPDREFWGLGERNTSITFHPDGRTVLVTACYQAGSHLMFCELDCDPPRLTLRPDLTVSLPADELMPAAFSPDGRWFAVSDWDLHLYRFPSRERAFTFEAQQGRRTGPPPDRGAANVEVRWSNVLFTPDGKTLICGSPTGAIFLWDVPSGDLRGTLTGHDGGRLWLALDPAGTLLASSGYDKTLRLWRLPDQA